MLQSRPVVLLQVRLNLTLLHGAKRGFVERKEDLETFDTTEKIKGGGGGMKGRKCTQKKLIVVVASHAVCSRPAEPCRL